MSVGSWSATRAEILETLPQGIIDFSLDGRQRSIDADVKKTLHAFKDVPLSSLSLPDILLLLFSRQVPLIKFEIANGLQVCRLERLIEKQLSKEHRISDLEAQLHQQRAALASQETPPNEAAP